MCNALVMPVISFRLVLVSTRLCTDLGTVHVIFLMSSAEGGMSHTFLLRHRKGRGFLFEVDHMVVVPSIRTFHHDVVMDKVGALVNDDVNETTAKEDT